MSKTSSMQLGRAFAAACSFGGVLCISSCTVGPDFKPVRTTSPQGWVGMNVTESARPLTSTPDSSEANIVSWWATFHDAQLTSLIERGAVGNLGVAQAESRIRQARAAREVAASGLYPNVSAGASAARSRTGSVGHSSTGNTFRAGFDATWELDIFGGIRRGVEAADASVQSSIYNRQTLLVSLSGEIAAEYFNLRGAQRQLDIARQNLSAQQRTLNVTTQRHDAGFVSALDVANARANLTQTESSIPLYDAQVRGSMYTIGVLLGQEPGNLVAELDPQAPLPILPDLVPIGLPSELLLRRPDIRQAEADLHAATARIGVALADQYPKFSLTGSFGTQGSKVESLGTLANRFWTIGPSASVPIFTGGLIQGNIEQAREQAEQATLAYRQVVLVALQDVETALVNFTREQQRRAALADAVVANQRAVELSQQLYSAGNIDFLNVLTAQRQLYSTQASLTQSETSVATDLVVLYKALGGGWNPLDADASPGAERARQ